MSKRLEAVKTVRDMTDEELYEHTRAQRRKLFEMRFQQATGQVENHRQLREMRRDIARAMTIERENAKGINQESNPQQPGPAASGHPPAASPRKSPRRGPSLRRHPSAEQERPDVEPIGDNTPEEESDVSLSEVEPGADDAAEQEAEDVTADEEVDEDE